MFKDKEEMEEFFRKNKLSKLFHENSKYKYWKPGKELSYEDVTQIHYKDYPRFKRIPLLKKFPKDSTLEKSLEKRISTRTYSKRKLSLSEISKLLFYSFGITKISIKDNWDTARRTYPSAGARYPLEVYPIIFHSKDIGPGIYHYEVKTNSLELMREGNFMEQILESVTNEQRWIENCSMIILISAVFERTQAKYEERGYRFILMEAGHVCQNVYLMSAALELGCCAIGGFLDEKLNELLDLDGKEESVINFIVVG